VDIGFVDDKFDVEKAGSEDDGKCDEASFTKDRINAVFFEVSKRLQNSEREKEEVFKIFNEC
jgi:hypothetical protein